MRSTDRIVPTAALDASAGMRKQPSTTLSRIVICSRISLSELPHQSAGTERRMKVGLLSGSSLVALLVLSAFAIRPAQAQCVSNGSTITCSGDHTTSSSSLELGSGMDTLNLEGGTLVGDITSSGNSPDTFNLEGGRIEGSIDAGNGADTFNLAGSAIAGSLLGNNGPDTFRLSGGTVGGDVDGGQTGDTFNLTGSIIAGRLLGGPNPDTIFWSGGFVNGIDAGTQPDSATFVGLTGEHLKRDLVVDGGLQDDDLLWRNTAGDQAARYVRWELFELAENSTLTFLEPSDVLTLGDSGTGTGDLVIDQSSMVFAGSGTYSVVPFSVSALVDVTNAGRIDLTNGGGSPSDRLTIIGNYTGDDGTLALDTRFGRTADDQSSDVLEVSGTAASATGTTQIEIVAVDPDDAVQTEGNGILVVEATAGATTDAKAFFLDGGSTGAGPYEYNLFRSSIDGSGPENWYLRSEGGLPDPCEPEPQLPGGTGGGGDDGGSGDGGGDEGSGGGVVDGPFRPEVPLYENDPALTLRYGSMLLDTLHQRKGDDWANARRSGESHIWGRSVGRHGRQSCHSMDLDYDLFAVQAGIDLYHADGQNRESDRAGVYGAIGTGSADSSAFGLSAGSNDLNAYTIGGYWTHYGKEGWYIDALLQGTWYDVDANSDRPYSLSTNGFGFGASLEAGYPFPIADGWIIEPQAQLTYQHIDLDEATDGAATVNFSNVESLVGRLGARLARNWELDLGKTDPRRVTGWLRASFAYEFLGDPVTTFSSGAGAVPFDADYSGPSVVLNAGLDTELGDRTALYANLDYEYQFDDVGESIGGEVGLKVRW